MRWTLLLIVTAGLGATPAHAGWIDLRGLNLPVCTAQNLQEYPTIVADGAGGAIVAWQDARTNSGYYDIYAQHVLPSGAVDPSWPADGRALCTASGNQRSPRLVADGAGGAIVIWLDARNSGIYAQHVLPSGAVDPAWPVDGRAVCTNAYNQSNPTIVADGAGGAIVAWQDGNLGIYAHHILPTGAVDPVWPAVGRTLCTYAYNQSNPTIVADGAGGAIVTWHDQRSSYDIYAQHVLVSGAVDPSWPANGRALCTAPNDQNNPTIVADDEGGAIVTWLDYRSGNYDIYAQHVLASGAVDPSWPADGRALCAAANDQYYPTIVADGTGGGIVTWLDYRSGNADIYAQHVMASGAVDPVWPATGRGLCTAANDQNSPTIVADAAGGAIVAWRDFRSVAGYDIYAQHVLSSGAVNPSWPADGRALCADANEQRNPMIVADGSGGAIVAWEDYRSNGADIYAQGVTAAGHLGDVNPAPVIAGVRDTPNDQGGWIKLMWNASPLDAAPYNLVGTYTIWRSVPPNIAQSALASGARLVTPGEEIALEPSRSLRATHSDSGIIYWEFVGTQGARQFPGYSMVVNTTGDSVAGSNPYTLFMVSAGQVNGSFLDSAPDSGYSVDNLAPLQPSPLAAMVEAAGVALHWGSNRELDLFGYRIHRGSDPHFTAGPTNLVASKPDTGYLDQGGPGDGYYKIAAVDIHGNVSPYAGASIDLPTTTLMSLASMEVSAESVRLVWQAPAYPGVLWTLERSMRNTDWATRGEAGSDPHGLITFDDTDVQPGERYVYRVRGVIAGQEVLSPGVTVTIPEATFALESVVPNPLVGMNLTVWFTLPEVAPARLDLFDVSGRLIVSREVGSMGVGRHAIQLASSHLGAGIHFVKLTQGTRTSANRVASIR